MYICFPTEVFPIDTVSWLLAASAFLNVALCGALSAAAHRIRRQSKRNAEREKENALFLKTVAHDLRSPLANIKGYAELIADGSLSEEKSTEALYLISAEASRLASLAGRLTDGRDAPLSLSVFDLSALFHANVLILTPKAARRGISFKEIGYDADTAFYVKADESAVREVVYNLCDNAVKYADENSTVSLSLRAEKNRIACSVENACADFDAAELEKIRSVGYRGRSGQKADGCGLGLYITDSLLRKHGEDCALAADYADGVLRFSFSLPQAAEYDGTAE